MKPEIEVKFLDVDHEALRKKLKAAGAKLKYSKQDMRRELFDYPDKRLQKANWGRLRVRDEGSQAAVNYKTGGEEGYSQEIETTVGSYDKMCGLLRAIGLETLAFQETRREAWEYKGTEVVLDEWPWVPPFIEIEGGSEKEVKAVAAELDFDWDSAVYGNSDSVYRRYYPKMTESETINNMSELHFSGDLPQWLKDRQE